MSPSVVLVPGAPVLVPELAGSARTETDAQVGEICRMLRKAAEEADATRVLVLGHDPAARTVGDVRSSLARWGVEVPVGLPSAPLAAYDLVPDSLLVAWWLLDQAGSDLPRRFWGLTGDPVGATEPGDADLVVVVADGPASLTPRAPVPENSRGVALDGHLADWLAGGGSLPDPGAQVAAEVGWWSRPVWRALDALVAGRQAHEALSWAPFGVGYHSAWWPAESAVSAGIALTGGVER